MYRILSVLPAAVLAGCSIPPDNAPRLEAETPAALVKEDAPRDDTKPVLSAQEMEKLLQTDPIAFLERSIDRYSREVKGYRVNLVKEERINGKLRPAEHIEVCFREKPFSVLMDWKEGAGLAKKSLYVAGTNDDNVLVRPAGLRAVVGIVSAKPHGPEAKKSARFPITEFGIQIGSKRTLTSWKAAQKRGDLKITYLGTKTPPELDKRTCWVVQRVERPSHDPDGIVTSVFYFDTKTYLQLGSILTDVNDQLVGKYFFRDLELNPTFPADTFTRDTLRKRN